jgi:hypothetical protein
MSEAIELFESRPTLAAAKHVSPNLFPRFFEWNSQEDRAQYVKEILVTLATEGKLYLTDIFNQGSTQISDCAGQIMLGQKYVMEGRAYEQKIDLLEVCPAEVREARIKIRSIKDKTIQWSTGCKPQKYLEREWVYNGQSSAMIAKVEMVEEVYLDTRKKEASLEVWYAWPCLRQAGKFCAKAIDEDEQKRIWQYEEVKPEALQEEKRGPGRPAKA